MTKAGAAVEKHAVIIGAAMVELCDHPLKQHKRLFRRALSPESGNTTHPLAFPLN